MTDRIDARGFRGLVAGLHQTMDDASSWPWCLDKLAGALGAAYAIWTYMSSDDPLSAVAYGSPDRHEDFMLQHIGRGGNALNPSVREVNSGIFQTGWSDALHIEDVGSRFYAPEYRDKVLLATDLRDGVGVTALREGNHYTIFSAYTDKSRREVSAHTITLARRLAPQMTRLARSHAMLRNARRRLDLLIAEVHRAGGCVLALDAEGRVTYRSSAAAYVLGDLACELRVRWGRVHFESPTQHWEFRAGLANVVAKKSIHEVLQLRRADELVGVVQLHPVRLVAEGAVPSHSAVVLVVHSRAVAAELHACAAAARMNLTASEQEVLRQALLGRSLREIATGRMRSSHTVRHQLESLRGKFGVTSHADLLAAARR